MALLASSVNIVIFTDFSRKAYAHQFYFYTGCDSNHRHGLRKCYCVLQIQYIFMSPDFSANSYNPVKLSNRVNIKNVYEKVTMDPMLEKIRV